MPSAASADGEVVTTPIFGVSETYALKQSTEKPEEVLAAFPTRSARRILIWLQSNRCRTDARNSSVRRSISRQDYRQASDGKYYQVSLLHYCKRKKYAIRLVWDGKT